MNEQIELTFITTNGIRLHVAQAGPQDGPLVVLLHGFPEFWYGWRRQITPLAQAGYRVIAPDQRGYNLSEVPKGVEAYRIAELVDDIAGLLDALGRQDCCLVGHDWGAAVAWNVALTYPERVQKLAILNVPHPAVMLDFLKRNPRQMLKSWYIAFFQIPGLADWLVRQNDFHQAAGSLRGSSQPGTFSDEDIAEYKKAWKNSAGLTGMINWYRALARYRPSMPEDNRLHMPVRILWGKRDAFLSHEMAGLSAQLCDQAELTLFEHATHWVQHEEAEAVAKALIDFFG
ncbi:MAG: alpha/beta hydrolase [Anaerolineales bacterium]|nr:alpha/beta hydrolase [Anaerolineales bacterium]